MLLGLSSPALSIVADAGVGVCDSESLILKLLAGEKLSVQVSMLLLLV